MAVKRFDNKNANGNGGRVKFRYADSDRYVDLDVSNVDQSVAEELRSLVSSLTGRHAVHPARTLTAPKTAAAAAPAPAVDQHEIAFPPEVEPDEQGDEEEHAVEEPTNGNGSKRSYNYRPPKFLDDLDLSKATKTIGDFLAEKGNPTETNDRYIAVAVWLKEHMQIEEFTINHIYTVFDNLGWKGQVPVNHSQPLRDLKTKRHFLTKDKGTGYKVNWQGIQYVAKMGTA